MKFDKKFYTKNLLVFQLAMKTGLERALIIDVLGKKLCVSDDWANSCKQFLQIIGNKSWKQ